MVKEDEVGANGDMQHMKTAFKHLFSNTDASLYMFKNSALKCKIGTTEGTRHMDG
jgi:hypothetical protein